ASSTHSPPRARRVPKVAEQERSFARSARQRCTSAHIAQPTRSSMRLRMSLSIFFRFTAGRGIELSSASAVRIAAATACFCGYPASDISRMLLEIVARSLPRRKGICHSFNQPNVMRRDVTAAAGAGDRPALPRLVVPHLMPLQRVIAADTLDVLRPDLDQPSEAAQLRLLVVSLSARQHHREQEVFLRRLRAPETVEFADRREDRARRRVSSVGPRASASTFFWVRTRDLRPARRSAAENVQRHAWSRRARNGDAPKRTTDELLDLSDLVSNRLLVRRRHDALQYRPAPMGSSMGHCRVTVAFLSGFCPMGPALWDPPRFSPERDGGTDGS